MSSPQTPALGVQMYSLRHLEQPLDEILARVAEMGYAGVETVGDQGQSADDLRALLETHGLRVASAHVMMQALLTNFDETIAFHRAIGNQTLVIPILIERERGSDAASWREAGRGLNQLGKRVAEEGMSLHYHNHQMEMERVDGQLVIDLLLEGHEHVGFEPDLAWIAAGGADPLALLRQYSGRCPRVHAKDLAPSGQNIDQKGVADVGHGTLDWAALLPAAIEAGAEWLIVEHDMPSEPFASVQNSIEFLRTQLSVL